MTWRARHWIFALSLAFFAIAVTGLGVLVGWAMDHSLFPVSGGGWRCYVDCVELVWGMVLVPAFLFVGVPLFARSLTDKISN